MTSRRDNSPTPNASKARIVALEAELAAKAMQLREAQATTAALAAERTARESLARDYAELQARHAELRTKHAELERRHDLLVDEHERLKAFLKAYANEHHSENRIFPDGRQLKLLFDNAPELAAAREAALAEAAKLVEAHQARRKRAKRQLDKGLPAGLRRVVEVIAAPPEQLVCAKHGERELLGYDLQKRLVQADCIVSFDDTTCRMLVSDLTLEEADEPLREKLTKMRRRQGKSIVANMWVYPGQCRAPYDVFDFQVSRGGAGPADFFQHTAGVAVGDCYSGNLSYINRSEGRLRLAACWAHVRRKLDQCDTYQKQRDELLELINALYDIETRGALMTPDQRVGLRRFESRILLDGIYARLNGRDYDDLLKSDFKTAVGYIHNHWAALNVFVEDGRVPIDNNLAERLMKRVATGRKAWLFVNGLGGGRRSARLMSIVASAHRHDLDVETYLKDVLDRLLAGSTDYHSLLPDVWKETHSTALRTYREAERQQKAERKQARAAVRRLTYAS